MDTRRPVLGRSRWLSPLTGEAFVRFIMTVLATWRLTHLLAEEDGPADVVLRVRRTLGDSTAGRAMDCFYCLSVWVAAPVTLLVARSPREAALLWPAASGAACLVERVTAPETFTSSRLVSS
jgi:hypothetical protein